MKIFLEKLKILKKEKMLELRGWSAHLGHTGFK